MKIVDRRQGNYYELELIHNGVSKRYIPLGSYSFYQDGSENGPKDPNDVEQWIDLISSDYCVPAVLCALSCYFGWYKMDVLNEEDDYLYLLLFSNPKFKAFCDRYLGDVDFNPDIFMDNCASVPDYKILCEFSSCEDEAVFYEENGFKFEIVNSNGSHTIGYDVFDSFLIDERYLAYFKIDYMELLSVFENYKLKQGE